MLEPGTLGDAGGGGVVLLLRRASGDEEVGCAGPGLRGVILAHALPHLSHLGAGHACRFVSRVSWMIASPVFCMVGCMARRACWELVPMAPWSCAGVRVRQEGVVFAACEDEETLDTSVRPLLGVRPAPLRTSCEIYVK